LGETVILQSAASRDSGLTYFESPFGGTVRPSRHVSLLNKAVEAADAAIEIYNKPAFLYREEAFSILMLNAWELLLKARILKESGNDMRSIEVWESVRKKDGSKSAKRSVAKKNRAGNVVTISIGAACAKVRAYQQNGIDDAVLRNLDLLIEVRDNSVHLSNKSDGLRKRVQEVGSAALRNFAVAASAWFAKDLSAYNFCIMPLSFETPQGILKTAFNDLERGSAGRLVKLISEQQASIPFDPARAFNVGVQIDMRFVRAATPEGIMVHLGPPSPGAIPLMVTEEQVLASYPWDYADLTKALRKRYSDFKENQVFHERRKQLAENPAFCKLRLLDPKRPRGSKKTYFNPNILPAFDDLYTRRPAANAPASPPQSPISPGGTAA
jgi:hypothetical protein